MRDKESLQSSQEELLEWSRWGRSLFRQISDISPQEQKDKDIRLTIEEQFISYLGFGSLRSKLSILRSEKTILALLLDSWIYLYFPSLSFGTMKYAR